jgi:hypothetical protein
MGITRITALIIATRGDDVRATTSIQPDPVNGKWASFICLYRGDEFDHFLMSTPPIFETQAEAQAAGDEVIRFVREAGTKEILADADPITKGVVGAMGHET